jgi:hypothetical protein
MLGRCILLTEIAVVLAMAAWAPAQTDSLQLSSEGKTLPPAAVYSCSSITKELRCVSAVADDTAHLSENPNARILQTNGTITVRQKKSPAAVAVDFYLADEKTLLDDPKYAKVEPVEGKLMLPADPERRVLVAIYQGPTARTKAVWLLAPTK